MKAKIVHLTVALMLALSLSLMMAVPAMAYNNNVESATIHFQGALTDNGDGTYAGTIAATKGTYWAVGGTGYASRDPSPNPCDPAPEGGFDVYANASGNAYFHDIGGTQTIPVGSDHDAIEAGGPWGTYYDPDTADWCNYELELTSTHWYLRYNGGTLGNGNPTPMSGNMNWSTMYASEDDTGHYKTGGSPLYPGDAAANGGGAQAWDMDWSWGSEVIPLQLSGFAVQVTTLGGDQYDVTLTPAAAPGEGGCFIATAAYGTSSAAEINVLRAFRDEVLLESTVGSQLVEWYYQTSPPVADFISENSLLRTIVRELVIDPMVSVATFTQGIWGGITEGTED